MIHPGLADIPAPIGSQEVVATPTNAIVDWDNLSFVSSHHGTQRVQEFLLIQGGMCVI